MKRDIDCDTGGYWFNASSKIDFGAVGYTQAESKFWGGSVDLRLLVMSVACVASSVAFGASVSAEDREECSAMSDLGKTVMEARQAGISMPKLMDYFSAPDKAETGEIGRLLVDWAFEQPRYSTKGAQERAVSDFESEVYKTCYQSAKRRASKK